MLAALFFAAHRWFVQGGDAPDSRVELCGEVIGHLDGREIHAALRYRGRRYRFEQVVPDEDRHPLRPGEVIVAPGLLYVCEAPSGLAKEKTHASQVQGSSRRHDRRQGR